MGIVLMSKLLQIFFACLTGIFIRTMILSVVIIHETMSTVKYFPISCGDIDSSQPSLLTFSWSFSKSAFSISAETIVAGIRLFWQAVVAVFILIICAVFSWLLYNDRMCCIIIFSISSFVDCSRNMFVKACFDWSKTVFRSCVKLLAFDTISAIAL
uniref:Uncharacterized protein n=1 Tax=Cacopsylla melanoneura TaxID=428564 RepID=A0A8D8RT19_9HEMI